MMRVARTGAGARAGPVHNNFPRVAVDVVHVRGYDAGHHKERSWTSDVQRVVLTLLGMLFFSTGAFRLGAGLLQSSVFYLWVGGVLVLLHSETARLSLLRRLPRSVLVYLFKKSVLDILVDPSGMVKVYTLAALTSVLGEDDLRRLIDTLPRECDALRRPGLVHLLPPVVQRMLDVSSLQIEDDLVAHAEVHTEQGINEGEGGVEGGAVAERVEELPAFPAAETSSSEYFRLPFFFLGRDDDDDADGDGGRDAGGHGRVGGGGTMAVDSSVAGSATAVALAASSGPTRRVAAFSSFMPSSSSLASSSAEFDHAVAEIGATRLRSLAQGVLDAFVQHATAAGADAGWSIATGGTASDSLLLGSCLVLSSATVVSKLLAASPHYSRQARLLGRALEATTSLTLGAAVTTAVMLGLRTSARLVDPAHASVVSREQRLRVFRNLGFMWDRTHRRCAAYCRHLRTHAAMYSLCLCVTALLAWRMKSKLRQVKWLGAVLLARLAAGADRARLLLLEVAER